MPSCRPEEGPGGAAGGRSAAGGEGDGPISERSGALVEGPAGQARSIQMLASLQQQSRRSADNRSGSRPAERVDPAVQAAVADAKRSLDLMAKQMPAAPGQHRVGSGVA